MKALIRFAVFSIVLILAASCAEQEVEKEPLRLGSAIYEPALPVHLDYDTTVIPLGDFFEFPERADTVYFTANVEFNYIRDKGTVTVTEYESNEKVTALGVVYEGIHYHIPVFKNRSLPYRFTYETDRTGLDEVGVKGSFNGWNHKASLLIKDDDTWSIDLTLPPGQYEYLVVEDGREMRDRSNPQTADNGRGGLNSVFQVGSNAERPFISTYGTSGDSIVAHYGEELHAPLVLWENHRLDSSFFHRRGDRLAVALPAVAKSAERSLLRIFGSDESNRSNDLMVPLKSGKPITNTSALDRTDKQTYSMYFMMVDRFVNGDTTNDMQVADPDIMPPANYYGGDLAGVKQKIDEGYFSDLGLNTVWLSPITQNPLGAYGLWDEGGVRSKFSGYHGYWPISSSQVDTRFGDEEVLKGLIESAHSSGSNVILDYVANHVHEEHPVYAAHPEWATELYLPDSSLNTERWDEYRLTTWFDTFMPTLDLENPEVVSAMTDSALFWFENYDIDGFRHDATKHVATDFWRELTRKLKYRVAVPENRTVYQIGETYGNPELIGSYIGSGMLDGQFDFNLYDAAVAAFARDETSMRELDRVLNESLIAYGHHHLMGNISGNQDRARFISYADGSVDFAEDAKLAGWTRLIEISDPVGYRKLAMLHALNFTLPGVPVIYYGDEIGMPGANDPDNRRMMRFGADLSNQEKSILKTVTEIADLRRNNMALLYGDLAVAECTDHTYAYYRTYFDQTALVCFNKSTEERTLNFDLPDHISTEGLEARFGHSATLAGRTVSVTLPPVSFEILTP
ncbi:MAG: alpha-amylase [Flavobacteriales bacterium]|nr:alpha-amylase [Flavobacteriales bacterium]